MTDSISNADFSPAAVAKAVLAESVQRPLVLYPLAIGLLGTLAAVLLAASPVFVWPAAAGLVVGLGAWTVDYFLGRERLAAAYLKRLHDALAGRVDASIANLRKEFARLEFDTGLAQMEQLQGKFKAFRDLLGRKLNPSEMTYGRYLGMTEQVFLGGLDNLTRIADTLEGLSAIDPEHIAKRVHELNNDGIESAAQDRELAALAERANLRQRQLDAIDRLLAENEAAMTQIDLTMAAIANLDTSASHASMGMESAMQELKTLAGRAGAYGSADAQRREAAPPMQTARK